MSKIISEHFSKTSRNCFFSESSKKKKTEERRRAGTSITLCRQRPTVNKMLAPSHRLVPRLTSLSFGSKSPWSKFCSTCDCSTTCVAAVCNAVDSVPFTDNLATHSPPSRHTSARTSSNVFTPTEGLKAKFWTYGPPRITCSIMKPLSIWRKRSMRRGTKKRNS